MITFAHTSPAVAAERRSFGLVNVNKTNQGRLMIGFESPSDAKYVLALPPFARAPVSAPYMPGKEEGGESEAWEEKVQIGRC